MRRHLVFHVTNPLSKSIMTIPMRSVLVAAIFITPFCGGCGPTGDRAGEIAQLKQQLDERKAELETLQSERDVEVENTKSENASLREENSRLKQQLAALTGAEGLSIEERQRLLDE